jgi:hypothetical protein
MSTIAHKYIINFWIWWYGVQSVIIAQNLFGTWTYMLGYLNIVPMLTNLFTPLFQDYSKTGRIIAFPIRLTWVIVGSIFLLILSIPLIFMFFLYLLLPLAPLVAISSYIISYIDL